MFKAVSHCLEINLRWTHKNEASHVLWEVFLAAKVLRKVPKLMLMQEEHNWGSFDGLQYLREWPNVFTMFTLKLSNSVTPALQSPPNLKISLIECPSGVNFGTV